MDEIWRSVLVEIAWSFVGPIVTAAVTMIVGWLVFWWQKLFKSNFDEKARDTIHAALERGMLHAIQSYRSQNRFGSIGDSERRQLTSDAASYAERWSGGTIKAKSLSHSDLMELAVPHLPLPPGITLPGRSDTRDRL